MIEQTFTVGDSPRFVASISSGSIEVVESAAGVIDLRIDSSREAEFESLARAATPSPCAARRMVEAGAGANRAPESVSESRSGTTVRISCASADVTSRGSTQRGLHRHRLRRRRDLGSRRTPR